MRGSEFRKLAEAELENRIQSLREEIFNVRYQIKMAQMENTYRIRDLRKQLASALTIKRERELGINNEE